MGLSDLTFLLDIAVNETKYLEASTEYSFRVKSLDLFELDLENFDNHTSTKKFRKRNKKISKQQTLNDQKEKFMVVGDTKNTAGQTIYLDNEVPYLISNMENGYIELSVWDKTKPDSVIGRSKITWNKRLIDYIQLANKSPRRPPVVINEDLEVVNPLTCKSVGVINITIKLICLTKDLFTYLTQSKNCVFEYANLFSNPNIILNLLKIKKNDESAASIKKTSDPDKKYIDRNVSNVITNKGIKVINIKNNLKVKEETNENINDNILKVDFHEKEPKTYDESQLINKDKQQFVYNRNQVYWVNYSTVSTNKSSSGSKSGTSPVSTGEVNKQKKGLVSNTGSKSNTDTEEDNDEKKKMFIKKCNSECLRKPICSNTKSTLSLDLPQEISPNVNIIRCKDIVCDSKVHREIKKSPEDSILIDLTKNTCCVNEIIQKVEEVRGGVSAKMNDDEDPCFCTCECQFGFTRITTYCKVCGGYEVIGEDLVKQAHEMPMPCPIFHKLVDKSKFKTWSSGSESKRKDKDDSQSIKLGSSQKPSSEKRLDVIDKKNVESQKDPKKVKRKEKFKFNYGYKAPQIGHSQCAIPCTGTLDNVPKNMGWLWTAEDIPGMKFRPMWKPGAVRKQVLRMLRIGRNPEQGYGKKKKKKDTKTKRNLKRPLLIVHKKDGEFTVTIETMKVFSKLRTINQHPYEDKPVLTYTIGRTEEENRQRRKKKEKEQRRLERDQRIFIQSTFKDMCRDICLKTYQQALGILPNAEDPNCPCYPAIPTADVTNMDMSCSCSEDKTPEVSDTDSDEWIVEFTPPYALFDPTYKAKKSLKVDTASQYTYLDYRVKLVDRFGNPIPRFFKGPDGKQQCSDLGGFWSPDHKWLEINVDGFIAPDNRWAPTTFIGPGGDIVDAEGGKFQTLNGQWLIVGVDGYIDSQGKWKYYSKYRRPAAPTKQKSPKVVRTDKMETDKMETKKNVIKSETTWSCFGDATTKELSKLGITGHGKDKQFLLKRIRDMLSHGEIVDLPHHTPVFYQSRKNRKSTSNIKFSNSYMEKPKCHHRKPSDKGVLAVNDDGDKTYFRITNYKNKRPKQRLAHLEDHGISLSSFHVPCFSSFINEETMKKQLRRRLFRLASKNAATQVKQGWKPGAVSKFLLRKLQKAKLKPCVEEAKKRIKTNKKQQINKPTLVVSKANGIYRIEMQVTGEPGENNEYSPLIYNIENANISNTCVHTGSLKNTSVKEVLDLNVEEFCQESFFRAYYNALSSRNNDTEYFYEDECINSSCSSSDIDWEIHFTPPT